MNGWVYVVLTLIAFTGAFSIFYLEATGMDIHYSAGEEVKGYWSHLPKGNLDWCEPNYYYSHYISEMWNTLTSGGIALLGLISWLHLERNDETRFKWMSFALFLVGLGSIWFHATLSWTGQVADELPMLLTILGQIYSLWALKTRSGSPIFAGLLFILGVAIGYLYFSLPENPAPFQICFNSLLITVVVWSLTSRGSKAAKAMLTLSFLSYVSGAMLWVAEPITCRHAPYLQLHAWWHCFAGMGAYLWIQYAKHQRFEELGRKVQVTRRASSLSLPVVYRV